MILIRVMGGLGNQLFIYNYYLLLSKKFPRHKIYLDKTPFEKLFSSGRNKFCIKDNLNYVLDHFLNLNYLNKYICKLAYNTAKINSKYFSIKILPKFFTQKEILRDQHLIDNCYFSVIGGHFISKDLIQDVKEIKFERALILNDAQLILLNKIRTCNSVSMHIRGERYIKNANIVSEYAVIGPAFYEKAIECIKKKVENPIFFVFTNDQEYARLFFNNSLDQLNLVSSNPEYIDFHLMSNCKNNIIINSTFSWWAAFLNTNMNKIVVSPSKWSGNKIVNPDYDHLTLNDWIQIENA